MKKRFIACFLTICMVVSLCACGSGKTDSDDSGESSTDDEEIVVKIWECAWGNEQYEQTLKKLAEEATAAKIDGKNIRVDVTMIPWDTYTETFMTAATSGDNPDIACQASTAPTQYAEMGLAMDLMPIYEQWKEEGNPIVSETGQAAFDFQTYEGKLVGIPFGVDGNGLIYNKDIFEQAGITDLPTTFEELTDVAKKIKEKCPGVSPFAFRADHSSQINWLIYSNGGCLVDTDYTVKLGDESVTDMLDIYQSWWDEGYIAEGSAGYSSNDIRTMVMNGDAAITLTNIPAWASEESKSHLGVIAPLKGPGATDDTYHSTMSYQAYYAYNTTEHPEETLAVLKWWLEHNDILYTEGGNSTVPIRESQMKKVFGDDEILIEFYNKYLSRESVAVPYIYPFTSYESWQGVVDGDKTAVKPLLGILTGEGYSTGLQESIEDIEIILKDYGIN